MVSVARSCQCDPVMAVSYLLSGPHPPSLSPKAPLWPGVSCDLWPSNLCSVSRWPRWPRWPGAAGWEAGVSSACSLERGPPPAEAGQCPVPSLVVMHYGRVERERGQCEAGWPVGPDSSAAAAARVHQGRLGRGSGRHRSHATQRRQRRQRRDQHRLQ